MEQQATTQEQTQRQPGPVRTPDRWLLTGSLIFHLLVFLLLPSLIVEARQPIQLLIELVQPDVKEVPKPTKPAGKPHTQAILPKDTVQKDSEETKAGQANAETAPVQESNLEQTPPPDPVAEIPVPPKAQPNPSDAAPGAAIPEMVAVPTHQPIVVPTQPEPVVEEQQAKPEPKPAAQPPAPVVKQLPPAPKAEREVKPEVKPDPKPIEKPRPEPQPKPEPAPAKPQPEKITPDTNNESSPTTPKPVNPVPDKPAPADPSPGEVIEGESKPPGEPTEQPEAGEEMAAAPPGPSELELGLLGEYGDGARKKITMLVRTPETAREQDMKGKCKFEFELRSDGTLASIKVLNSSGHFILDQECLEATRVAAPFKRFPASVSVSSWKFQMEIVFPTY